MFKTYRYRVSDVEHDGDYQPFTSAIIEGGGIIDHIDWTETGEDAIIIFSAYPNQIEKIKSNLNELL